MNSNLPGHHLIQAFCRCGQAMMLEAPVECDPELIDALARMTTCDVCASHRNRRQTPKPKQQATLPYKDQ